MNEVKLGVIEYISKQKFLIASPYNIFVTDKRLIFSYLTQEARKETERLLNEKVKGKSFKERLSIIMSHGYELPEKYNTMTFEEILNEHPKNFQLMFDQIIKIRVKRPKTKDSQNQIQPDYLVFQTTKETFKVTPSSEHALNLLNHVLGDKAKVPKIIF